MIARDTLTILGGALLAIVLSRLIVPSGPLTADGSPTPEASELVVGSFGGPVTLPPLATIGPVVNPTVGFEATPTPIPIITLGPPSPSPSVGPSTKPTAKPTPTPPPLPVPIFTCTDMGYYLLSCDGSKSTNTLSWSWDWGDGSALSSGKVASHQYDPGGSEFVTVTLTVKGRGGTGAPESQPYDLGPAPTAS